MNKGVFFPQLDGSIHKHKKKDESIEQHKAKTEWSVNLNEWGKKEADSDVKQRAIFSILKC